MPPSDNPNRHSSPWWRNLRHSVIERDQNICQYCGTVGHQIDYQVPPTHGGQPTYENLVCCCISCLNASNDAPYPTFEDKVAHILTHRRSDDPPTNLAKTIPGFGPKPYSLQTQPIRKTRRLDKSKKGHYSLVS